MQRVIAVSVTLSALATAAYAQRAEFYGLGVGPVVRGLSGDGRVAAGYFVASEATQGALWERGVGWRFVNAPSGYRNLQFSGASGDGGVICGTTTSTGSGTQYLACRYSDATGVVPLSDFTSDPPLPGERDASSGDAISRDGRTVVGVGRYGSEAGAALWREDGVIDIAGPPRSLAVAVSGDGRFVGGTEILNFSAFIYDSARRQAVFIGPGSPAAAFLETISDDGTVAAGGALGWRWNATTGFRFLDALPDNQAPRAVSAMSADGTVLAGGSRADTSTRSLAFIWRESLGSVYLTDYLDSIGVSYDAWVLKSVEGMSADGRHLVGLGINPDGEVESWYAFLPDLAPPLCSAALPCPADFDHSGGVDGDDITAFISSWQLGEDCGDIDRSGGVDGEDIGAFIGRWQMGC